jgi:hypothetical protein
MDRIQKDMLQLLLTKYLHPIDAINFMRTHQRVYNIIPIEKIHKKAILYYKGNENISTYITITKCYYCSVYVSKVILSQHLLKCNPQIKQKPCDLCDKMLIGNQKHRCMYKKHYCLPISQHYKTLCNKEMYSMQRKKMKHFCDNECLTCGRIFKDVSTSLKAYLNRKENQLLSGCICNIVESELKRLMEKRKTRKTIRRRYHDISDLSWSYIATCFSIGFAIPLVTYYIFKK